jgi:hypothetical protein
MEGHHRPPAVPVDKREVRRASRVGVRAGAFDATRPESVVEFQQAEKNGGQNGGRCRYGDLAERTAAQRARLSQQL